MEQVTSKKLKIRPAATVKTIIIYLIVLLISFIFAFPCIWLILSSFNANGSLLTLDGFFPESHSFETSKTLFTEKVEHDYEMVLEYSFCSRSKLCNINNTCSCRFLYYVALSF